MGDSFLCVSKAMKNDLVYTHNFSLKDIHVIYDKPPTDTFRPISLRERHQVMSKYLSFDGMSDRPVVNLDSVCSSLSTSQSSGNPTSPNNFTHESEGKAHPAAPTATSLHSASHHSLGGVLSGELLNFHVRQLRASSLKVMQMRERLTRGRAWRWAQSRRSTMTGTADGEVVPSLKPVHSRKSGEDYDTESEGGESHECHNELAEQLIHEVPVFSPRARKRVEYLQGSHGVRRYAHGGGHALLRAWSGDSWMEWGRSSDNLGGIPVRGGLEYRGECCRSDDGENNDGESSEQQQQSMTHLRSLDVSKVTHQRTEKRRCRCVICQCNKKNDILRIDKFSDDELMGVAKSHLVLSVPLPSNFPTERVATDLSDGSREDHTGISLRKNPLSCPDMITDERWRCEEVTPFTRMEVSTGTSSNLLKLVNEIERKKTMGAVTPPRQPQQSSTPRMEEAPNNTTFAPHSLSDIVTCPVDWLCRNEDLTTRLARMKQDMGLSGINALSEEEMGVTSSMVPAVHISPWEVRWSVRPDRGAVVVSSTSWTPDEDMSLLLNAMKLYDRWATNLQILDPNSRHPPPSHSPHSPHSPHSRHPPPPHITLIITGKGPMREKWLSEVSDAHMAHVAVRTVFTEPEDYPKLLAAADIGISLHYSSSGLDLPMKAVDMLAVGLPVLSYSFRTIHELVEVGRNALLFNDADSLFEWLRYLLRDFPSAYDASVSQLVGGSYGPTAAHTTTGTPHTPQRGGKATNSPFGDASEANGSQCLVKMRAFSESQAVRRVRFGVEWERVVAPVMREVCQR
eukprot:GHVN01095252.1.p1 GENE.GHVN01095252.1~~GHVN01095252.1.p1  ORF type:complete len:892 (-),score=257.15 GHVN01095252.1:140-2524(-)